MASPLNSPPRRHTVLHAGLALLVMLSAGCASVGAPEQTLTLGKTPALQLQADGTKSWASAQLDRYEAIQIDASAIRFGAEVQLDAAQREALQQALATALSERFKAAGLPTVNPAQTRPSLKLEATVTAVQLAKPAVNVITSILLLGPLSRGGLTVEVQAVDARTGQPAAALAFTGQAGVEDITTAFSDTGHAASQADAVAQRFVALFDRKAVGAARAL